MKKNQNEGCLLIIGVAVSNAILGIALGLWLGLVMFAMAFHSTASDRMHYVITSALLWVVNPIGMIGLLLHKYEMINPNWVVFFFLGGLVASSTMWALLVHWWCSRKAKAQAIDADREDGDSKPDSSR